MWRSIGAEEPRLATYCQPTGAIRLLCVAPGGSKQPRCWAPRLSSTGATRLHLYLPCLICCLHLCLINFTLAWRLSLDYLYVTKATRFSRLHRIVFTAMLCISAVYVVMRCPSVCLSVRLPVCLSRLWIMSKRINISSKFFHHRVATPF